MPAVRHAVPVRAYMQDADSLLGQFDRTLGRIGIERQFHDRDTDIRRMPAQNLLYADLEGMPVPKIYLNKGFDGLAALFVEKPRPAGARLALHEAERISMAKGVWLALFQVALAAVNEPAENEEPEWPDGWQGEVLKKMLARVHPDLDASARLSKAIEERRSDGARHFESLVLAAVSQDMIKEGKGLETSLMALEQAARGDAL